MTNDPSRPTDPAAIHGAEPMPEGEEHAPPGTRTAAIVRWALVGLMGLAAVGGWVYFSGASLRRSGSSAVQYHCPMHPSVVTDHPGSCPICGMDLVLVQGGVGPKAQPLAAQPAGPGAFWCPMHPEVTSDDPNAVCEKCGGMKLVPRPKEGAAAGVPGLSPVELSPERIQLIGMRTAPVVREKLAPALRTVGIVTADEGALALVTTRISGWIEQLAVTQTGQHVRKGEVLARIYSPDLLTAQLAYLNALKWLGEREGVAEGGAATAGLERDARARLQLAGIADQDIDEIVRTGKPLRAVGIRAPASGYVGKKTAVVGLYVQPGTELFEIVDLTRVWVVADVYEYEIERIRVGLKANVTVPALAGQAFSGKVAFIYPAVNTGSRTLQARLELQNPGLRLRPGMYANVTIDLGSVEGLVVPSEAVVDTGDVQYVFVALEGGRFDPRRVKLGARGEGKVQVLDGVTAGERVVTTANFLVDSESRLRAAIEGFSAGGEAPKGAGPAPAAGEHKH